MQPHLLHVLTVAITAAILGGCSSTSDDRSADKAAEKDGEQEVEWIGPDGPEPYDAELARDQRKTGAVLAKIDASLRLWNNITLGGDTDTDGSRLDIVEASLRREVNAKIATLIEQLEFGPPSNRQIAAAALGFSNAKEALGPLLAALDDTEPEVVSNALFGLSQLRDPDTPIVPVAAKLEDVEQPLAARNNAGRTLRAVGLANREGEEREAALRAGRVALADEESALRVQGALILAELVDSESIPQLARALSDTSNLVVTASSRALARIGSVDEKNMGRSARALVAAYRRSDEKSVREQILLDLQAMTKRNYGDDEDAWIEFAQRLP